MVGSASIRPNIHHDIEIDKKPHYIQIEQSPNFPYTENLWTIESVFTKGLRRSYFTGLDTALCVFGATFLDVICNSHLDIGFDSTWSYCVGRHLSQLPARVWEWQFTIIPFLGVCHDFKYLYGHLFLLIIVCEKLWVGIFVIYIHLTSHGLHNYRAVISLWSW